MTRAQYDRRLRVCLAVSQVAGLIMIVSAALDRTAELLIACVCSVIPLLVALRMQGRVEGEL